MDINIACLDYCLWNSIVSFLSPTKSIRSKELYLIMNGVSIPVAARSKA